MDCVEQCVMDVQLFLFVCLFDGWMDALQKEAGGGAGEGAPPQRKLALCGLVAWFVGCWVGWMVCWFGRFVAWLVGRLVGTPRWLHRWVHGRCVKIQAGEGAGEGAAPPPSTEFGANTYSD